LARHTADVAGEGDFHLAREVYTAAANWSERLFGAFLLLLGLQVVVKLGDVVSVVFKLFFDLGSNVLLPFLLKFDIFLSDPLPEVRAREDFCGRRFLRQCGLI